MMEIKLIRLVQIILEMTIKKKSKIIILTTFAPNE